MGFVNVREQIPEEAYPRDDPHMHQGLAKTQSGGRRKGAVMTQRGDSSARGAVNLVELLARVENDHDLLGELIDIFKEDFPRLMQSLRQSVAREDMKNVEDTSHALKGMLSGLSVTAAAAMASRLEQLARAEERLELTNALALFENEVVGLLPELDGYTEAKP
jgi:HPt (histidine-containing phosphotransfer) domain-containing protein